MSSHDGLEEGIHLQKLGNDGIGQKSSLERRALNKEMSEVNTRKRVVALLSVLVLALALLPGTAFATRVWQGDDYSQTVNSNKQVQVCDYERDGNQTYSKFFDYKSRAGRVQDSDGAGGYCYNSDYRPDGIEYHNTCEDRKFRPDPCTKYYRR